VKRAKAILLSRFLWLLLGVIGTSLIARHWVLAEGGPREAVAHWGIWAPIGSVLIQTISTPAPGGALCLSMINGALYRLWIAVLVNLLSGILGAMGMYYIWRRGGKEFALRERMQSLPPWLRRHVGDNLPALTLLRLVPWAGGGLADMIAGTHHVPLRTQFLSCLIGYIPGSVIYALAGKGIVHLWW
jgi:uncharacterized membrane protein YdjX (TVP38/TMEM64 family)